MNKYLKKLLLSLTVSFLVIGLVGYYFLFPTVLNFLGKQHRDKVAKELDLSCNTLKVGENVFEFFEGGKGKEVMILIHGFEGNKLSWLSFLPSLKEHYHLIVLDLPGHGGSFLPENHQLNIYGFADDLETFITAKGLKSFHLFGQSMGGGVSSLYAAKRPETIKTLILLNPLGVDLPEKSTLQVKIDQGKNFLFPQNIADLDEFARLLTGKPFPWNSFQKWIVVQKIKQKEKFYEVVYNNFLCKTVPIDEILPTIEVPVLLLYGEKDNILHPSSFYKFHRLIPNIRTKVFEEGHHLFLGACLKEAIEEVQMVTENGIKEKKLITSAAPQG